MSKRSFAFIGAFVATLSGFPAAGLAQQGSMRELTCRGAADIDLRFDKDPSPFNERMIRFSWRYRPGHQPVGYEYENLQPGTCSWNPGNWPTYPVEPGIIYIDVMKELQDYSGTGTRWIDTTINAAVFYPDAVNLPRYLKDPGHYWVFYVDDVTNISHSFLAAKHNVRLPTQIEFTGPTGQSTDRAGTADPTSGALRDASPSLDAAKVPLTFREVVRSPTQYRIKFGARANANATVQYSLTPPVRIGGVLKFQSPKSLPVAATETRGFASEYSTTPARGLPMGGTKVYFVIRVPEAGKDQPAQEYSGEFDTIIQSVVVRFSRIHILNDSDKNSAGDLAFRFFLAPGSAFTASCLLPDVCWERLGPVSWETGSDNAVNPEELRLDRAPNVIRVWVAGWDNDRPGESGSTTSMVPYGASGRSSSYEDMNNARGQYDISRLANNARLGFKLRSIDGSVLMYEVHGEIEVLRR